MMTRLLPMLLLSACSFTPDLVRYSALTPAQARAYGVDVPDGAVPTGTIVAADLTTFAGVERVCGESYPFLSAGCARDVDAPVFPSPTGRYVIVAADVEQMGDLACALAHEAGHALYETSRHTVAFEIRNIQRHPQPACP